MRYCDKATLRFYGVTVKTGRVSVVELSQSFHIANGAETKITGMQRANIKAMNRLTFALLIAAPLLAVTQSSTQSPSSIQQTQVRGYWTDPATGLMWAAKDNGKDVSWRNAIK
jgi:hypothetical protein